MMTDMEGKHFMDAEGRIVDTTKWDSRDLIWLTRSSELVVVLRSGLCEEEAKDAAKIYLKRLARWDGHGPVASQGVDHYFANFEVMSQNSQDSTMELWTNLQIPMRRISVKPQKKQ